LFSAEIKYYGVSVHGSVMTFTPSTRRQLDGVAAPDSLVDVRTGVIAAQAEFEKDGNAAVKAAAIERAKAVAKQAVAEVAGSVRGKNGRAEADLSSSELYAAKRALISCLQGLPDEERLSKVDRHGVRGCEFEASMDWSWCGVLF
jgi:hypothetical protein